MMDIVKNIYKTHTIRALLLLCTVSVFGAEEYRDSDFCVKVVYFPGNGEQYGAVYDVKDTSQKMGYCLQGEKWYFTCDVLQFLRDVYLQSQCLRKPWNRPRGPRPVVTDNAFRLCDVDKDFYRPCQFRSAQLEAFLTRFCPAYTLMGRAKGLWRSRALTADVLTSMLPRYRRWLWSVVEYEDLEQKMQQNSSTHANVFIQVPGEKVLKGELERAWCSLDMFFRDDFLSQNNLLCHKMTYVWADQKYSNQRDDCPQYSNQRDDCSQYSNQRDDCSQYSNQLDDCPSERTQSSFVVYYDGDDSSEISIR